MSHSPKHSRLIILLLVVITALLCLIFVTIFYNYDGYFSAKNTDTQQQPSVAEKAFLQTEEAVIIVPDTPEAEERILPVEKVLFEYVMVKDSCGPHFEGDCVIARSGPSTSTAVMASLRNDLVLKVGGQVENEGRTWYKIVFDEWLRYPERLRGDWYVAADFLEVLYDEGTKDLDKDKTATTSKSILVDRSEQKLYAYNGEELFMETSISTGREITPTPRGIFTVFKKTPSRYMQGPLPYLASNQYYDLPGVPWNLYFTNEGAVIHGAYWHTSFGIPYSNGCVNMDPDEARTLYIWAELGTKVTVRD